MAYAVAQPVFGTSVPKVWKAVPRRSLFGDVVIVLFLLSQMFDGAFTYLGIVTFGTGIEANPLIVALMTHLGHGAALMTAKMVAAALGIGLHLRGTHAAVAALAVFYLAVAVLPWTFILFF